MPEIAGSFTFVLHAHLPYGLSHRRWPHGTDWLNEAAAETDVPLPETLRRLVADGISPKVTIGITPILGERLRSPAFREEFGAHLRNELEAAEADEREFSRVGPSELTPLARHWRSFIAEALEPFLERYRRDIVEAFAALKEAGHIEVITSAATHGHLPLLSRDAWVQAQIRQGVWKRRRRTIREQRGRRRSPVAGRRMHPMAPEAVRLAT